jgi:hypothetical protein
MRSSAPSAADVVRASSRAPEAISSSESSAPRPPRTSTVRVEQPRAAHAVRAREGDRARGVAAADQPVEGFAQPRERVVASDECSAEQIGRRGRGPRDVERRCRFLCAPRSILRTLSDEPRQRALDPSGEGYAEGADRHAEREQVRSPVDDPAQELGRDEAGRPRDLGGALFRERTHAAQIDEDAARRRVDEDVPGMHVAVQQPSPMQRPDRRQHVANRPREIVPAPRLRDHLEVGALDEDRGVERARRAAVPPVSEVVDANEARMAARAKREELALQDLARACVGRDELQRDLGVVRPVAHEERAREPAFPERAHDHVAVGDRVSGTQSFSVSPGVMDTSVSH